MAKSTGLNVRSKSDPERRRIYRLKNEYGEFTFKIPPTDAEIDAELARVEKMLATFLQYTNKSAPSNIIDAATRQTMAGYKATLNNRVTSSETYADGAPELENPFWLEAEANAMCKRALEKADAAVASAIQQPLETRKSIMSKETTTKSTDTAEEVISPAVLATSAMVTAKGIEINETGGAIYKASFAETFDEHTPAGLTPEVVEQAMEHLSRVAAGVSHAHGHAAVKASAANKSITKVTGSFPGPGRASLHLSYKHERSMPDGAGEGTKVVHGTMQVSWNNLGGPGGKNFDAVRSSVRRAAAASEAANN